MGSMCAPIIRRRASRPTGWCATAASPARSAAPRGLGARLDLSRSTLVGDKLSDLVAARAVGAQAVLVLTGYGLGEWEYRRDAFPVPPDHVAEDLLDAVDWVIGSRRS